MSQPTPPWRISPPPIRLGTNVSQRLLPKPKGIRLVGDGPCVASTCHAVEQQPFRWDCNGFYRRLGLTPEATRADIAQAFLDTSGHASSALTDAAKVLLDKETRRVYDSLPLGVFWARDEALIRGVIDGEFEDAHGSDGWSLYLDEIAIEAVDRDIVDLWRWMIAWILWRANSPVEGFAMGVSDDLGVAIIGFRIVAFVPLDSKPTWEYVRLLAVALQELVESPAPSGRLAAFPTPTQRFHIT